MNHEITYLHCGEHLQRSLKNEIDEVLSVVDVIKWEREFKVVTSDSTLFHQTAYNQEIRDRVPEVGLGSQAKIV